MGIPEGGRSDSTEMIAALQGLSRCSDSASVRYQRSIGTFVALAADVTISWNCSGHYLLLRAYLSFLNRRLKKFPPFGFSGAAAAPVPVGSAPGA